MRPATEMSPRHATAGRAASNVDDFEMVEAVSGRRVDISALLPLLPATRIQDCCWIWPSMKAEHRASHQDPVAAGSPKPRQAASKLANPNPEHRPAKHQPSRPIKPLPRIAQSTIRRGHAGPIRLHTKRFCRTADLARFGEEIPCRENSAWGTDAPQPRGAGRWQPRGSHRRPASPPGGAPHHLTAQCGAGLDASHDEPRKRCLHRSERDAGTDQFLPPDPPNIPNPPAP